MQKRRLAIGLVMLVASAVSYERVHLTEASPAGVEVVEAASSSVGIHAAITPMLMPVSEPAAAASMLDSVSDAALFGATGAALIVIAAGVKRRAC